MEYKNIAIPLIFIMVILVICNCKMKLPLDFSILSIFTWAIFGCIVGIQIGMYVIDEHDK